MSAYSVTLVFVGERCNPGDVLAQRPSGVFVVNTTVSSLYTLPEYHFRLVLYNGVTALCVSTIRHDPRSLSTMRTSGVCFFRRFVRFRNDHLSSGAAGNRNPVLTESLARVLSQSNPSCPSSKYKRTLFAGHFGFLLRMRARSRVT